MPVAWRIVKVRHAATAFTGEGAAKVGGRWNSRGTAVVYASGTKSLAALEILVHLIPPVTFEFVGFRIEFDDSLVERIPMARLPHDWTAEPPGDGSKLIGDEWARRLSSPVLEVPSVLIPDESNYLLNPGHPEFSRMKVGSAEPFSFDPRLVAR